MSVRGRPSRPRSASSPESLEAHGQGSARGGSVLIGFGVEDAPAGIAEVGFSVADAGAGEASVGFGVVDQARGSVGVGFGVAESDGEENAVDGAQFAFGVGDSVGDAGASRLGTPSLSLGQAVWRRGRLI